MYSTPDSWVQGLEFSSLLLASASMKKKNIAASLETGFVFQWQCYHH